MAMALAGRRQSWYSWLRAAIFIGLGIYGYYVFVQYGRINELNERELANASAELKRAVEYAYGALRNAGNRDVIPRDFDTDQDYLDLSPGQALPSVSGRLRNPELRVDDGLGFKTTFVTALGSGGADPTVEFDFRTDVLLEELSFPETFELIVLAKSDGDVLFEDAPASRRWRRYLGWGEREFLGAVSTGSVQVASLGDVVGGTWEELSAKTSRTTAQLGGTWHQLYLQPLVIENGTQARLIIAGAVRNEVILRQALAMDTYFLSGVICLLLLFLLGLPFVRLFALDERERFSSRDVVMLHLSAAALMSLVTFATLGWDGYQRWSTHADEGLETLAREVERVFLGELGRLRDQLEVYDRRLPLVSPYRCDGAPGNPPIESSRIQVLPNWFDDLQGKHTLGFEPSTSLHIEQLAFVGPDGLQVWKVTADRSSSKVQVATRPYIRAVASDHLFRVRGEGHAFYAGPARSITDGKLYTFVSMPSVAEVCLPVVNNGVAALRLSEPGTHFTTAMSTKLLSLARMPLPAGYGFVIVNREGGVEFHADERLSLRENFFDEHSQGERLRGLVYSAREGTITSNYRTRPHSVHVRPLDLRPSGGGPTREYSVATFRDQLPEHAVVGRVFLASLVGPLGYVLLLVAAAIAGVSGVARREFGRWDAWLWLHGGQASVYQRLTVVFGAVLALGLVSARLAPLATVVLLPIVTPVVGIIVHTRGVRRLSARTPLHSQTWQVSAVVLLVVAMVIVPCAVAFRTSLDLEFGKLVDTEREWVQRQRTDGMRVIADEARAAGHPDSIGDAWANAWASQWRQEGAAGPFEPPAPFDKPAAEQPANAWAPLVFEGFSSLVPMQGDSVTRHRFHWPPSVYQVPRATWSVLGLGWTVLAALALIALALWWAVWWSASRLSLADLDCPATDRIEDLEAAWQQLGAREQMVLLQTVRDGVPNPRQREAVEGLLRSSFLALAPYLRPASDEVKDFVREKLEVHAAALAAWEDVDGGSSRRYVRLVSLVAGLGLLFFLGATQPGLQATAAGVAGGVVTLIGALQKLREQIAQFLPSKKA